MFPMFSFNFFLLKYYPARTARRLPNTPLRLCHEIISRTPAKLSLHVGFCYPYPPTTSHNIKTWPASVWTLHPAKPWLPKNERWRKTNGTVILWPINESFLTKMMAADGFFLALISSMKNCRCCLLFFHNLLFLLFQRLMHDSLQLAFGCTYPGA